MESALYLNIISLRDTLNDYIQKYPQDTNRTICFSAADGGAYPLSAIGFDTGKMEEVELFEKTEDKEATHLLLKLHTANDQ